MMRRRYQYGSLTKKSNKYAEDVAVSLLRDHAGGPSIPEDDLRGNVSPVPNQDRCLAPHRAPSPPTESASSIWTTSFSQCWLRGVDLNHQPLGYEPTVNWNFNLQDAGGYLKAFVRNAWESLLDS
jgi:hypothetical protein